VKTRTLMPDLSNITTRTDLYPDKLAAWIFYAGWSFEDAARMLTGFAPGTPEHAWHEQHIQDVVRQAMQNTKGV
jgi:hypothetical protein